MRLAIIGLGLIGGSIGLALKQANWRQAEVVGYVRRCEVGSLALKLGAVDRVESTLSETVKGASIVIIATPILTIKDIFSQIAPDLSDDSIVTDTASTKLQIMRWAEELLPPEINFVGGHPMAGKEISGVSAATADLFHNCTYCLTIAPRAKPAAVQTVKEMAKELGATPLAISAQEHDRLVAGISHLPLLLSVALVSATTKNPSWQQMSRLAASGYRDLTRLASGSPEVNAGICLSNSAAIVSWIDGFSEELQRLRKLVADESIEIEKALAFANEARQKWLKRRC
ncbi:prephenate dehydrogenase [Chloroflexota bacterium]